MNKVFLLLGGNLGDRIKLLHSAKQLIQYKIGNIEKESSIYESLPWGFEAEQNFLNQVAIINTNLSAQKVLKFCQEIENDLGRKRYSDHYESRTMDIDILFYNDEIINDKNLIVPHPKLHQRRFTLEPLVEISPEYVHPVLKKRLQVILNDCKDNSEVTRLYK